MFHYAVKDGTMINCLLARKRIYAYLNDDLSDTELREFMEHVENCPECMEELKITHMVYTGAKSLDDAESGTLDFETSFKRLLIRSKHYLLKLSMLHVMRYAVNTMSFCSVFLILLLQLRIWFRG